MTEVLDIHRLTPDALQWRLEQHVPGIQSRSVVLRPDGSVAGAVFFSGDVSGEIRQVSNARWQVATKGSVPDRDVSSWLQMVVAS